MNRPSSKNDWKPCPPGVVSTMISRQRSLYRRRLLRRGVWIGLIVVALLPAAVVLADRFEQVQPDIKSSPRQVRMACREVLALRNDYLAGNISAETKLAIERHLDHCPYCARRYQEGRGSSQSPAN